MKSTKNIQNDKEMELVRLLVQDCRSTADRGVYGALPFAYQPLNNGFWQKRLWEIRKPLLFLPKLSP